jgi:dephospho-CoA kinase
MLKIGITGGIGSGKTTVTQVFKLLNIPVYYADAAAKQLMTNDTTLVAAIKKIFGYKAYLASGHINSTYIANIVFNNPLQLQLLNSLVHPAVFAHYTHWCTQQKAIYILKEAALLFETNFYTHNNYNILVSAPLSLRIKNLIQRDSTTEAKIMAIIDKQMPEFEKQKLADFTIQNNEQSFIINQVLKLHTHFLKIA